MSEKARVSTNAPVRQQIVDKAMADPAFKKALLDNPKDALEKELGVSIPPNVRISVLQENVDHLYLVLPFNLDEVELPDEVLEQVAGVAGGW